MRFFFFFCNEKKSLAVRTVLMKELRLRETTSALHVKLQQVLEIEETHCYTLLNGNNDSAEDTTIAVTCVLIRKTVKANACQA